LAENESIDALIDKTFLL